MSHDYLRHVAPGVRTLEPYQPGKPVEELQRELGLTDVIKLASNENPFGPGPRVLDALRSGLSDLARYPDASGWALKSALSESLEVPSDMLTLGNGSNEVLELVGRVFAGPGDEIVVTEHCFVVYPLVAKALGATLTVVPDRDFEQDLDGVLEAVDRDTRVVYLANPNNPTGTWVRNGPLRSLLRALPEGVVFVLDEAYAEYVDEPDYPNGIELLADHPNLVVTRTFSKAYGLAALRIGYAVSDPSIADLLNRVRQPFNANALAQSAACVALSDAEHVRISVESNRAQMARLEEGLRGLGLGWIPSAANFLTVEVGAGARSIYEKLLRMGVIVRPLEVYGMPRHLRVTIGRPGENQRFLDALAELRPELVVGD